MIIVYYNGSDEKFSEILELEGIKLIQAANLNVASSEILQYLTVGGGITAIAKCILQYLKIHSQRRKIAIELKNSIKIEIEGQSVGEIEKLLETAERIIISNNTQVEKNGS